LTRPRRLSLTRNLKRGFLRQTASYLLFFRVVDGLAAWFLVAESHRESFVSLWPFHGLMLAYFAVNRTLERSYRDGRVTRGLLRLDLGVNFATVTVAAGLCGGLVSPLSLIFLSKVVGYGFLFSPTMGTYAMGSTFAGFWTLYLGEAVGWWTIAPVAAPPYAMAVFYVVVLAVLLGGAVWLFRQFAEQERRIRTEMHRARASAAKERQARSVTSVLVAVSEAISRLTRIDSILETVAEVAPRMLPTDYCFIFRWNDQAKRYECAAVSGIEPARSSHLLGLHVTPAEETDLEWVRRLGHSAVIAARNGSGSAPAPFLLASPLLSGGRFYGILLFARRSTRNTFTQNELRVADGIAGQTAVALERTQLIEHSQRLVQAMESTAEGVLITDSSRRIVFTNPSFLAMFGYDEKEVLGRDSLAFRGQTPDNLISDIRTTIVGGNSWHGEATAQRKDKSIFPASLHISVIRGEGSSVQGTLTILEDITEKQRMQEQLKRADRLAVAGELGAGVAHEVNNALAGLLGQVNVARSSSDSARIDTAVTAIETQAQRIAGIVQELLGFARPQVPHRTVLNVRELVNETLSLMTPELARARVDARVIAADDLPDVLADRGQLQQVLVNLFTNAAQAMYTKGGGLLTVSIDVASEKLRVQVQDTGVGIPADIVPRIFDPFYSTKERGSGLGLSVSYAIITAQGGDLSVHSDPGEGTTFSLTLPIASTVTSGSSEAQRLALVVDDEPVVAETLSDMLVQQGFEVRRAASGEEALKTLGEQVFDVVCLDLRLPDLSGEEVYARLAEERPEQAQRVIFVTGGLWRSESRGLRSRLPAQPLVGKPCTVADIREAVRELGEPRAAA
jgi:PAS domain S-box-containing protein